MKKPTALLSTETLQARVAELGAEITRDYQGSHDLVVVPILKGSFIFAADLIRSMHGAGLSPEVDFMMLASYRAGTTSSGRVEVLRDIEADVKDRDVLLIDDILESVAELRWYRRMVFRDTLAPESGET